MLVEPALAGRRIAVIVRCALRVGGLHQGVTSSEAVTH